MISAPSKILSVAGSGISEGSAGVEQPFSAQMKDRKRAPKVGVALFDNAGEMSSGWACLSDEHPFRFGSVHELSNAAIWVTNLTWEEYRLNASKLSHLRRVDFLRSSLPQIAADMGRRITGEFAKETAPILANVVQQAVLIAVSVYQWEEPISEIREDTLADDIKRTVAQAPKPKSHLRSSLSSAHQSYSSPAWPPSYEPDSFFVTLRFNRLSYARSLLSNPMPDEGWSLIPSSQPELLTLDCLLDPCHPCLVEATVELGRIDPGLASLISFGATPNKRAGIRKWISQPELAWLSRHTRVNISAALVCTSARSLPETAQFPALLSSDPLFELSISAGLIAECHWTALASPTYNKLSKSSDYSAWATWLRAVDRSMCFDLALKAHNSGFLVNGYGNGSAVIRATRDRLQDCLGFAEANAIAHPAFFPLFVEHGRTDLMAGIDLGML